MKKLISCAVIASMLFAIPEMALAKGAKGGKKAKDNANLVVGKVTAVDATANTITVSKGKKAPAKTLQAKDATITVDGKTGKLTDITVGMKVSATVGTTPDTANAITATTGKKKK